MLTFSAKRLGVIAVSICLIVMPLMQSANAALISTESAIEMTDRQDRIDHINVMLSKDSVKSAFVRLGVNPADASDRVAALTDSELLTMEEQLNRLPAGGTGVVEVVGIVAIVMIILELLHVTNFFSEF